MQGPNGVFPGILDDAVRFHGHLCEGLVLGVRMAMAGLRELGIEDPKGQQGKDLVIFVEIDRCPVDGIIAVTGRTPGKRSIKMMDYGKTAAVFVDTRSGKAVRVSVRRDYGGRLSEMTGFRTTGQIDKQTRLAALQNMAQDDLLTIQAVSVPMQPQDLPGKCVDEVICEMCGETVKDTRQVMLYGRAVCRPCSEGGDYYTVNRTPSPKPHPAGFVDRRLREEPGNAVVG